MDISTITSAYSAIKAIKEIGTSLLDAKIDTESKQRVSDVIEKLGSVQDTLFYIREELLKVQNENHELKEKIKVLEEKLNEKSKVHYIKPSYWVIEGEEKDGPFCQKCYDTDKNLVRLQDCGNDIWTCRECKSPYYGPNHTLQKARKRQSNRRIL